ncbi:hypothetical protein PtB15_4B142 [Puccinia triticina]|nr:hypothetical protein PtB15_4B142 [Puccinia triticina]
MVASADLHCLWGSLIPQDPESHLLTTADVSRTFGENLGEQIEHGITLADRLPVPSTGAALDSTLSRMRDETARAGGQSRTTLIQSDLARPTSSNFNLAFESISHGRSQIAVCHQPSAEPNFLKRGRQQRTVNIEGIVTSNYGAAARDASTSGFGLLDLVEQTPKAPRAPVMLTSTPTTEHNSNPKISHNATQKKTGNPSNTAGRSRKTHSFIWEFFSLIMEEGKSFQPFSLFTFVFLFSWCD